jgi:hypothetical protein
LSTLERRWDVASPDNPFRIPAFTRGTIPAVRLAELKRLLEEAWSGAAGGEYGASGFGVEDLVEVTFSLSRNGENRTVVDHGAGPAPLHELLRSIMVQVQEWFDDAVPAAGDAGSITHIELIENRWSWGESKSRILIYGR